MCLHYDHTQMYMNVWGTLIPSRNYISHTDVMFWTSDIYYHHCNYCNNWMNNGQIIKKIRNNYLTGQIIRTIMFSQKYLRGARPPQRETQQ
jgi:hypothetical protein